jgi:methyl-accepting chemotaxis protein
MLIQAAAALAGPAESNFIQLLHVLTIAAAALATSVSTYVSMRLFKFRSELRKDMEEVVTAKCADRAEFNAHVTAEDLFQRNLVADMVDKRESYRKQHEAHFAHEARMDIHQSSMSSELIQEKFEHVKTQVESVSKGMDNVTKSVERLTAAVNERRNRQWSGDN